MARQKKITGRRHTRKPFNDLEWIQCHIYDKANFRRCKKHYQRLYQVNKPHVSDVFAYLYQDGDGWQMAYTARPKQKDCVRFKYKEALETLC